MKAVAVLAGFDATKANSPPREELDHHVKMFELFVDNLGHLAAQLDVFHIVKNQIERSACRFLLAVRVVDEHFLQIGINLGKPTRVGGSFEM
jgi:hypothetical protein